MMERRDERRAEDRAPITLRVAYRRLNTFFADYTRNLSKGGTFVRTTKPLALGTMFNFVLSMPTASSIDSDREDGASAESDTVELSLEGVVKWIVAEADATEDRPAGMGIEFVFDGEAERRAVEENVAEMMRVALGPRLAAKLLGS